MTICTAFEHIVNKHPTNIALLSDYEGCMTYHELNEYANYIAELLINAQCGNTVGIIINRSFSLFTSFNCEKERGSNKN